MKSWVKDAFICWDPRLTGRICNTSDLMGVMKRLGANLSRDDADQLMNCYDTDGSGEMTYAHVVEDLLVGEPAFVGGTTEKAEAACITARAPAGANNSLRKISRAAQLYTKKSKGVVDAKDVILGTFMRFDPTNSGRVSLKDVAQSINILQVKGLSNRDIEALVTWFDTNGSHKLDYHELIKQLYGSYDDFLGGHRQGNALSSPSLPSIANHPFAVPANQIVFSDEPVVAEKTLPPLKAALQTASNLPPSLSDTKLIKEARRAIRTKQILSEKVKIENKIAQIEKKKKALVESYKMTHGG